MNRSALSWIAVRLAIALFVVGGVASTALADPSGTVRVALGTEPSSLDPNVDETTFAQTINQAVYDTLVKMNADLEVIPWLAESWEPLDDVTWRFYLREGVRFHTGNPFNAEAVKAHYDRAMNPDDPGTQSAYLFMVDEVAVVDEYTVDFHLNLPYGAFVAELTLPHLSIVDATEASRLGANYGVNPSGTGPFRLEAWDRGSSIRLVANTDYWQEGQPSLAVLEFVFIPEASGRITALQLGEVDIITNIPAHEVPRLEADPSLHTVSSTNLRTVIYKFNMRHPILSDVSVRRAIVHAIDMELIADLILEDAGDAGRGFVAPGAFGALDTPYRYNPELSARLLEQAGWAKDARGIYVKDGAPLNVSIMTAGRFPRDIEIAEAIQSQLLEFGIEFRVERTEHARITEFLQRPAGDQRADAPPPEFDMIIWGVGVRNGEAGSPLQQEYVTGGIWNGGHYSNTDFDRLTRVGLSTAPDEVRRQAFEEAQRILYAEVPAMPLFNPTWLGAARSNVSEYFLHPTEQLFWGEVKID